MEKKCKKCGKDLDNNFSDYCLDCLKSNYSTLMEKKKNEVDEEAIGKAESVLNVIAKATLILGTIAAIILFFVGFDKYSDYGIGITLMIWSVAILISTVVTWAVLKVLCNISNNLQEINKKMKG
jgi:hypothetical protein